MANRVPTNTDNMIDSRDVFDAIEDLSDLNLDAEGLKSLEALKKFSAEAANYSEDWGHGETAIRYDYFEQYARDLADDLGVVDPNAAWPLNHVDWKAASRDLMRDYTAVDFDGVEYYVR